MRTSLHHHAIRLAVSFAIAIGLVGCGDDDDATSTTPPVAAATTDPPVSTVAAATTEAVDTTTATTVRSPRRPPRSPPRPSPPPRRKLPDHPRPDDAPPAVPYTSPEGDFSVLFPGEPTALTQPQTLPDGSVVDLVLVSYQLDDLFVATARSQYPDGYVLDVPVALQGAQDQAVANIGATLISSEDITLQGRPGKQFSASLTGGGTGCSGCTSTASCSTSRSSAAPVSGRSPTPTWPRSSTRSPSRPADRRRSGRRAGPAWWRAATGSAARSPTARSAAAGRALRRGGRVEADDDQRPATVDRVVGADGEQEPVLLRRAAGDAVLGVRRGRLAERRRTARSP